MKKKKIRKKVDRAVVILRGVLVEVDSLILIIRERIDALPKKQGGRQGNARA